MNWLLQHYSLIVFCRYDPIGGFQKGGCRGRGPETTIEIEIQSLPFVESPHQQPSPAVTGLQLGYEKHHQSFSPTYHIRKAQSDQNRPHHVNFGGSNAQVQKNGFALARASPELQADPVPWLRGRAERIWQWMGMTWCVPTSAWCLCITYWKQRIKGLESLVFDPIGLHQGPGTLLEWFGFKKVNTALNGARESILIYSNDSIILYIWWNDLGSLEKMILGLTTKIRAVFIAQKLSHPRRWAFYLFLRNWGKITTYLQLVGEDWRNRSLQPRWWLMLFGRITELIGEAVEQLHRRPVAITYGWRSKFPVLRII